MSKKLRLNTSPADRDRGAPQRLRCCAIRGAGTNRSWGHGPPARTRDRRWQPSNSVVLFVVRFKNLARKFEHIQSDEA
jgi:hypothetical protein